MSPLPHPTLHSLGDAQANFEALQAGPKWIKPSLSSGWSGRYGSGYADAGYLLDPFSIVRLRGFVQKSTTWVAPETIFTLPPGMQPAAHVFVPVCVDLGFGIVEVRSTGEVRYRAGAWSGASSFISLDGIAFPARG